MHALALDGIFAARKVQVSLIHSSIWNSTKLYKVTDYYWGDSAPSNILLEE